MQILYTFVFVTTYSKFMSVKEVSEPCLKKMQLSYLFEQSQSIDAIGVPMQRVPGKKIEWGSTFAEKQLNIIRQCNALACQIHARTHSWWISLYFYFTPTKDKIVASEITLYSAILSGRITNCYAAQTDILTNCRRQYNKNSCLPVCQSFAHLGKTGPS